MHITGIILTGGRSSRIGTDKAFLEFEGKTLLNRALDFCESFCNEVIISSNYPHHKIANCRYVTDEKEGCGPIAGIYSCLKQSANNWNFVLSVDSPFVETDFVSFLFSKTHGFDAVIPFHKNGKEPLIAIYHKNVFPEIESQLKTGNYRILALLNKVKTNFVDSQLWVEKYPNLFLNVNYLADLNNIN